MPRIARVVVPEIPHHITQRGNRNQIVFFSDDDRVAYLELIKRFSLQNGVKIWAYCLMDNHVHFVAVPGAEEDLRACFQEAHRLYTRRINFREGWRGYLWQGRFASFPMDEKYLVAAIRYVERNPIVAGIVKKAEDYPWSSAKAHVLQVKDPLLSPCFLSEEIPDWSSFLRDEDDNGVKILEKSIRTGRPLGSTDFVERLESLLGRDLKRKKPGRRPRVLVN